MTSLRLRLPLFLIAMFSLLQILSIVYVRQWPISYCVLPGVVFLLFLWVIFSRQQHTLIVTAYALFFTVLFIWLGIVGLWSQMPETHYYFWGYLLVWPIIYWIYIVRPEINQHWNILYSALVSIGMLSAALAMYQYWVLHHIPLSYFGSKNTQSALANLLVFPLVGYFINAWSQPEVALWKKIAMALVIIFLFISVTLSGSRAATLGAIIGGCLLVYLLRSKLHFKHWWGVVAIMLLPILYGIFFGIYAGTAHSFWRLVHPLIQGENRFLLWQPAWQLIKQHGWFGIGLGNFYWYLPALRSIADHSAGLYVHNDYLQFWLEGGVPAILLLGAFIMSFGYCIIGFVKLHKIVDAKKVEVISLFVAIFTVFFHSLFSFNLYSMPILLPMACYLGRITYLLNNELNFTQWQFNASNYLRKPLYYAFGIALALVLGVYYFSAAATLLLDIVGDNYLAKNNFNLAGHYYQLASLLQPNRRALLISEVQYYNKLDRSLVGNNALAKIALSMQIKQRFSMLEKHHPLYAYNYYLQARYYSRNQNQLGKQANCKIQQFYIKTLALRPHAKMVNTAYKNFLKKHVVTHCEN